MRWRNHEMEESHEPLSIMWIRQSESEQVTFGDVSELYPSIQPLLVNISLLYRPNALKKKIKKKRAKYSSAFERIFFLPPLFFFLFSPYKYGYGYFLHVLFHTYRVFLMNLHCLWQWQKLCCYNRELLGVNHQPSLAGG